MQYHRVMLLLLARVEVSTPSPVPSRVPLNGIVEDGNGTTTTLNLDEIKASMNTEIFDFSNPVIPTLSVQERLCFRMLTEDLPSPKNLPCNLFCRALL